MSSPEVWAHARPIIEDAADIAGLPVAWPNEPFDEPQPFDEAGNPMVWVAVEIEGDVAAPMGIGGDEPWNEGGTIHLAVMIPNGTGIMRGLEKRKALATAFRNRQADVVVYGDIVLDPGGPGGTDGRWRTLALRVGYSYQDIPV